MAERGARLESVEEFKRSAAALVVATRPEVLLTWKVE
jgi:hypothetical protein